MTLWTKVPEPMDLPHERIAAEAAILSRLPSRRSPPRAALVGGGLIAAVALTGAGVAYLAPQAATETSLVDCHTTAELGRDGSFVGASLSVPSLEGAGPAQSLDDAVAGCAELWRDGWIRAGSSDVQPPAGESQYQVPQLTACVTDRGVVAVFPAAASVCSQLGLAPLDQ